MDALTHLAAPAALACILGGRRRDLLLAGVGGWLPDIEKPFELAMQFAPGGDYLLFRHGGAHSVAGTALLALGAVVWVKWQRVRGFGLLWMGALTHLLLDGIVNPRGFLPFLPFSPARVDLHWEPGAPLANAVLLTLSLLVLGIAAWRARRSPRRIVDRAGCGT